jgi:multidrug transporter EmrE-like cation transporter
LHTGEQEIEMFTKPLFQTFGMFVGMLFGLIMHWFVLLFKIPFPGYYESGNEGVGGDVEIPTENTSLVKSSKLSNKQTEKASSGDDNSSNKDIPTWMYFFLAIPAIFDLAATALCMMGLQYLDVSVYQMLRGSGIIFVALMKQHVLKEHLVSSIQRGFLLLSQLIKSVNLIRHHLAL